MAGIGILAPLAARRAKLCGCRSGATATGSRRRGRCRGCVAAAASAGGAPGEESATQGQEPPAWEWGEVYIWGGVTWKPTTDPVPPGPSAQLQEVDKRPSAALQKRVWGIVSEQYAVAARDGSFAGVRLSPTLAAARFQRLTEALGVSDEEALETIQVDATPLLVESDDMVTTFEQLVAISSSDKALELVKRHPGLLVGGVRGLKDGVSLVRDAVMDIFFAGRLRGVLDDNSRDNGGKLAEIEFYASIASLFKPVMDLAQRRAEQLWNSLHTVLPILLQVVILGVLVSADVSPGAQAFRPVLLDLRLAMGVFWLASWGFGLGPWGLGLGSWALGLGSSLLGFLAWVLSALPSWVGHADPWSVAVGSWILAVASWALRIAGSASLPM